MKIRYDLHIHSCLSPCGDNEMTPNSIAGMAKLGGLTVAALTDHNTSLNCPAFFEACGRYGVVPIAGMELTTLEDIHMICLFPTLDGAMDFERYVAPLRMKIKNKPRIFGEQLIMDSSDEVTGSEEMLLIPATGLDIATAADEVRARGGAVFPAHIEKQANSILPILGDFPDKPEFFAAEIFERERLEPLRRKHARLREMRPLFNSDAHTLEALVREPCELDVGEGTDTPGELRRRIISILGGCR